ncbi:MAG: hypothetical protein WDO19_18355 [Bacteroidota bacterium]
MVITLLTISYQAVRAALANPVKSLRRNERTKIFWIKRKMGRVPKSESSINIQDL